MIDMSSPFWSSGYGPFAIGLAGATALYIFLWVGNKIWHWKEDPAEGGDMSSTEYSQTPIRDLVSRLRGITNSPSIAQYNSTAPAPTPVPAAPQKKPVFPAGAWLTLVNERYDEAPHLLIVGSTGSGKTYLAQVVIANRTGKVLILDPKWKPGKWGGLPAISLDDDLSYRSLEHACQQALEELKRRQVALKTGQDEFEPLTIVVEELPTLLDECPTAPQLFKRLGQLGRELRIRVIGLSQSDRVKTLKLEGEGDARANYMFIRLGSHATKHCLEAAPLPRPATVEYQGVPLLIDVVDLDGFVHQRIPRGRAWDIDTSDEDAPSPASGAAMTAAHVKVAAWMTAEPDISQREVARRLWGNGSGKYNQMAGEIMRVVTGTIGEIERGKTLQNGKYHE